MNGYFTHSKGPTKTPIRIIGQIVGNGSNISIFKQGKEIFVFESSGKSSGIFSTPIPTAVRSRRKNK